MKTQKIGQIQVDLVLESEGAFAALDFVVPNITQDQIETHAHWLKPIYVTADNRVNMSFHSYILKTPTHTILVDACAGNDKERPLRPPWHRQKFTYLENMARLGVKPEDIDFVCCTHMHADHVGWNTRLENGHWVPTFPKARYVFANAEYRHWEKEHRHALAHGLEAINHGSFADSVLPVVDAGRALMVDSGFEFETGIELHAAHGHTAGNCLLDVRNQGDHAVFAGDILHTPAQLIDLSLSSRFCHDPEEASRTREALVHRLADTSTLLFTGHFPSPTAGRIVGKSDHFRFENS
jgi:glyoxylase-like metal-dependent hydrolase (beta-lactamase superfamily II)